MIQKNTIVKLIKKNFPAAKPPTAKPINKPIIKKSERVTRKIKVYLQVARRINHKKKVFFKTHLNKSLYMNEQEVNWTYVLPQLNSSSGSTKIDVSFNNDSMELRTKNVL